MHDSLPVELTSFGRASDAFRSKLSGCKMNGRMLLLHKLGNGGCGVLANSLVVWCNYSASGLY